MEQWTRADLVACVGSHEWQPRTCQIFVEVCRRFIAWAKGTGLRCPDFVGSFKPPSAPPEEAESLSEVQMKNVLKA